MICQSYDSIWTLVFLVALMLAATTGWGSARLDRHWTERVVTMAWHITAWACAFGVLRIVGWIFARLA